MSKDTNEVSKLLEAWSRGEPEALDRLIPLVFDDLHSMARRFFLRESDAHTLQPTALVSEVYFKLRGRKNIQFETRAAFFAFASDVMRSFLVDYARKKGASKRAGEEPLVSLSSGVEQILSTRPTASNRILDVHMALEALAKVDERQAKVVELRFFLGLLVEEVAELLEVSEATVKREWRTAKRWLKDWLNHHPQDGEPSSDA